MIIFWDSKGVNEDGELAPDEFDRLTEFALALGISKARINGILLEVED